ncbi:hypothetical protein PGTUg99_036215 [Puccinia graminis f. sp. tritici]|uniref:Uncharacterized protein n=1 Tax=Puccinia graminis f. sp. tritici TaxID=56615 RepID=A0A5B0N502_PUCGR|nr:hypothetical protein PGTUg99_036215 [Puccinia graminis f. sp. tritici]
MGKNTGSGVSTMSVSSASLGRSVPRPTGNPNDLESMILRKACCVYAKDEVTSINNNVSSIDKRVEAIAASSLINGTQSIKN